MVAQRSSSSNGPNCWTRKECNADPGQEFSWNSRTSSQETSVPFGHRPECNDGAMLSSPCDPFSGTFSLGIALWWDVHSSLALHEDDWLSEWWMNGRIRWWIVRPRIRIMRKAKLSWLCPESSWKSSWIPRIRRATEKICAFERKQTRWT